MPLSEKIQRLNQSLGDYTHVFAVPGSDSIIDAVRPETGRSMINDLSLDQLRERDRNPAIALLSYDEWAQAKAARQQSAITWVRTTADRYDEMLNVLPPVAWDGASFLVGEPYDHCVATGRARYQGYRQSGDSYYVSSRPLTVAEFKTARFTVI